MMKCNRINRTLLLIVMTFVKRSFILCLVIYACSQHADSLRADHAASFRLSNSKGPAKLNDAPVPTLPADLRRYLQNNAVVACPIAITWKTSYSCDIPIKQCVGIGKFPEGSRFFKTNEVSFSRQENKYSYKRKYSNAKSTLFLNRFDGHAFYLGSSLDSPGRMRSVIVHDASFLIKKNFVAFVAEYFERAGFLLYNRSRLLHKPQESLILTQLNRAGTSFRLTEQIWEDVPCVQLRIVSDLAVHSYYLDPSMNYAVRGHEEFSPDDSLVRHTTNSDFVEFKSPDIWLPKQSKTDWYTWYSMNGKIMDSPLVHETIEVTELNKDRLPPDQFVIDITRRGTIVADDRLPGAEKQESGLIQYQVPADFEYFDQMMQTSLKGKVYERPMRPLSDPVIIILFIFNAIIFAVGMNRYISNRS